MVGRSGRRAGPEPCLITHFEHCRGYTECALVMEQERCALKGGDSRVSGGKAVRPGGEEC